MEKENFSASSSRLVEIERLMEAFREDFALKTADVDNFITIHEIERMWGELEQNTLNIYSGMVREAMGSVDEKELIRKKKVSTLQKE
jgi:hypothetical protein